MRRILSHRSGRKALTTIQAAVIVVILVIAAAATIFYVTQQPTTPPPTYKDTIIVGTTDSVQTTIDPADSYDYFGINIIENIGDGLVDYVPGTTSYAPALATDWSVSSDGLTWTFNLRQGVKFADGTPFNATVVKYTLDREFAIDEPEGPFAGVGYDTVINRTVVTGPYQVQFVLNSPFSAFLALVAFTPMYPVNPNVAPASAIVNYTGDVATSNPNGLGPYMLTKWIRTAGKDVEMDLQSNPNYWNASSGYPKTKNIIIRFYTDHTALLLALKNHEVDIAYRQFEASDIISLQSDPNFKVWTGPGAFIQYLVFNTASPPFNNLSVRQAMAAAVNRSLITQGVFQGQDQPLYSMVPAGMFSHTDAFLSRYGEANLTYAKQLLAQAGYSTSNKLSFTLTYPTGHYSATDGIAQALKQAFEATGMVSVNLAAQPWPNYKESTRAESLQAYIYGWYPDFVDPYDYLYPFLPPDGIGFLHTRFVDAQINQWLNQVTSISQPSQQLPIYTQVQSRLADLVPMVPLFQGTTIAVSTPKVSGIVLDATVIFRYWLLTLTA
jgi:peptide/nickel transport system substrate-binding protein